MEDDVFSINYYGSGNLQSITRCGEEVEETEETPEPGLKPTVAFGESSGGGLGLAFYPCDARGWCRLYFNGKWYRYRC